MYRVSIPENRQADPDIYMLNDLGSPDLVKARGVFTVALYDFSNDSTLSFREREALRMQIAEMVECNICRGFRPLDVPAISKPPADVAAARASVDPAFYANAANYRTWSGYSEREKLAMEFVERMANDAFGMRDDEAFWARMKKNFTDQEVGDLTIIGGAWVTSVLSARALGYVQSACPVSRADAPRQKVG